MRFDGIIYFQGPKTKWSGRIAEEEIIAKVSSRFHWIARWLTRSAHAHLDRSRCGYAIISDDKVIEHIEVIKS